MPLFDLTDSTNVKAISTPIQTDSNKQEIILAQGRSWIESIPSTIDSHPANLSSVSNAGDVNDDGIDDIIISIPLSRIDDLDYVGKSYVVFGSSDFDDSDHFDLNSLDGDNGFALEGTNEEDFAGTSVSNAGDINDDGIDDLILGAPGVNANGQEFAGEAYVIFGSPEIGGDGSQKLSDLDSSNGFVIKGLNAGDNTGVSASNAGDVNNDGIDDIILSSPEADINGRENVGQSHVIFGNRNIGNGNFDLNSLDGSNGFTLNGIDAGDKAGIFVSNAGDVNDDGIADILIGVPHAKGDRDNQIYVVFGSSQIGGNGSLELSNLDGSNGFVIQGDSEISSASDAGDVNHDGIDDIAIGSPGGGSDGATNGENYVVFGHPQIGNSGSFNLSQLNGKNGARFGCAQKSFSSESKSLNYSPRCGNSVSGAGDINNDGIDDLIVGAVNRAKSYAVFGNSNLGSLELSPFNDSKGFTIQGNDPDRSGYSNSIGFEVSNAGDIDDDGIDDIVINAYSSEAGDYSYLVFGGRQSIMTIDRGNEIPKPEIQALNLLENHSATLVVFTLLFASSICWRRARKRILHYIKS